MQKGTSVDSSMCGMKPWVVAFKSIASLSSRFDTKCTFVYIFSDNSMCSMKHWVVGYASFLWSTHLQRLTDTQSYS
jgi:hypothetical protein